MSKHVEILTVHEPADYSQAQIDEMCLVHTSLNRGVLFVFVDPATNDLLREEAE